MGMWRPNKGKGWGQRHEAEPANRFTQILRTVLEVVPGGVIRYGKTGPDDDAHTGFWLGVTPEGVAKFSIGGPGGWLKWDGENLHVRGALETFAGDYWPNWLAFYGADGEPAGHIMGHDAWGHQIDIATPRQDADGRSRHDHARVRRRFRRAGAAAALHGARRRRQRAPTSTCRSGTATTSSRSRGRG